MDSPIFTIILFAGLLYGIVSLVLELRHYKSELNLNLISLSIVIMMLSIIGIYTTS